MKFVIALVIGLLVGKPLGSMAADTLADATALAAQRDAEERAKRLAADIQSLQEAQEVIFKKQEDLRQRLDRALEEIRSLKEDQTRASGNAVTREEVRKYIEKLAREIDEKREADKNLILEKIKELGKVAMATPPEPKPARKSTESSEEPPFVYTVKKNDRLLDIIAEYNDYFQKNGKPKITVDQVLKANPGLKADHLIAGHKIRIPAPSKDSK